MHSFPKQNALWVLFILVFYLAHVTLQIPMEHQDASAITRTRTPRPSPLQFPYTVLAASNILTPDDETREYQYIQLHNGMKVLLISDPGTQKAAAALSVRVGSSSDPESLPGLSHLVEHVVHMGTRNYQKASDYFEYISDAEGKANAFTRDSQTCFYFGNIHRTALHGALKRFAQIFKHPLFQASNIQEEITRIDLEYKRNMHSEFWRHSRLKRSLCNSKHPYTKFGTGNSEMLKKIPEAAGVDVQQISKWFHHNFYVANHMDLVIFGKEPLSTLAKWAHQLFASIVSYEPPTHESYITSSPWDGLSPYETNQVIRVNSSMNEMHLVWCLPSSPEWQDSKPEEYLAYLFESTVKGSLYSILTDRDLVFYLKVHLHKPFDYFSFFELEFDLPNGDTSKMEEILVLVFQYIRFLKTTDQHEAAFKEFRSGRERRFKFGEELSSARLVTSLVDHLFYGYPPEQILSGKLVPKTWNASRFSRCLDALTEKFQIYLFTSQHNVTLDKMEKIYQTAYAMEPISQELLSKIKTSAINNTDFALPEIDYFFPFFFVSGDDSYQAVVPKVYYETYNRRFWHLQNNSLWYRENYISIAFKSSMIGASAKYRACSELLVILIKEGMDRFIDEEMIVGISFQVDITEDSIGFILNGDSNHYALVLREAVRIMTNLASIELPFETLKSTTLHNYEQWEFLEPVHRAKLYVRQAIQRPLYSPAEKRKALLSSTFDDVIQFTNELCKTFFIESLYIGKVMDAAVFPVFQELLHPFKATTPSPFKIEAIELPRSNFTYVVVGNDPQSSAVAYYLQVCSISDKRTRSLLGLFSKIAIPHFTDYFNNIPQDTFIMYFGAFRHMNTLGYLVVVQSELDVETVEKHIQTCLINLSEFLTTMKLSDFQEYVQGYVDGQIVRPTTLKEQGDMFWHAIMNEPAGLHVRSEIANMAYHHNLSDILKFYFEYIYPPSPHCRRFVVRYLKAENLAPKNSIFIQDLREWVLQQFVISGVFTGSVQVYSEGYILNSALN